MKIGVIGLGLIGGSIFKSLKAIGKYELVGVSTTVNDENISSDYDSLKVCDLVFVCSPMNATLDVLDKLESIISSKAIVTDVCSLKTFVSKKKYNYKFIPSHPMAGTEHRGWENSFIGLFKGAKWAITPINGECLEEQEILECVIRELGAEPIITTPEEHDKAVALISHMPMVIAQALCENIKDNKLAQELASTGFKDTTRLALSNIEMASDMVNLNLENIKYSYSTLKDCMENLLNKDYVCKAEDIKMFRQNLYN
jgi:arogenate dehydrogenase (NADP+)